MVSVREAMLDDEDAVFSLALDFPSPTRIDKKRFLIHGKSKARIKTR